MTRKQEIQASATDKYMYTFSPIPPEAKELFQIRHKAFVEGALWADENPDVQRLYPDQYMILKQKIIIAIEALKKIESGGECSACSCNCHEAAHHALNLTK